MHLPDPSDIGTAALLILALILVVLLGVAVFLLVKLLRMFSLVRREDMPLRGKLTFWAALIYTIFPLDVLADPVYIDDVGVLAGALAYLTHLVSKYGLQREDEAGADRTVSR